MHTARTTLAVCASILAAGALVATAGPLNPPFGPISPTYKTLTEVEPRIPISAVNTPGDADSTFRIFDSGSYYLTGNMVADVGKKGIEVVPTPGAQITIDLNGFTMNGLVGTTQAAISIEGSLANVTIRNGAMRFWKSAIVQLGGTNVTLEGVHAHGSNSTQFDLRLATVTRCFAEEGASNGFSLGGAGIVTDCTSRNNVGAGFAAGAIACTFRDCISIANDNVGFALASSIAENCRAESNAMSGFTNPAVLTDCVSNGNGANGVGSGVSSIVRGCVITNNASDGLFLSSGGSRVEGNVIGANFGHGINVLGARNTILSNNINFNGRLAGVFAGIFVTGVDNVIESNDISNMTNGGDDTGIHVTGTSNLIVRNKLTNVTNVSNIAAGNSSGGFSTTPTTAGAWQNISY